MLQGIALEREIPRDQTDDGRAREVDDEAVIRKRSAEGARRENIDGMAQPRTEAAALKNRR